MHEHERDAQADGEPDRDGDELEGGLEAGEVRFGRGRAGLLLRDEGEEAPVCEPRGELEEDAGDLRARGRGVVKVRRPAPRGDPELTLSAIAAPGPLRGRELHRHVLPVRLLAAVRPRRRSPAATLVRTR